MAMFAIIQANFIHNKNRFEENAPKPQNSKRNKKIEVSNKRIEVSNVTLSYKKCTQLCGGKNGAYEDINEFILTKQHVWLLMLCLTSRKLVLVKQMFDRYVCSPPIPKVKAKAIDGCSITSCIIYQKLLQLTRHSLDINVKHVDNTCCPARSSFL